MLVRVGIFGLLLGITLPVFGQGELLPKRLVLCLDGVSWRDLKALQQSLAVDKAGRSIAAFNDGYYPVSRLVSTFPSSSDVAWTEMLGNEPLPGYSRSYFDSSANKFVVQNGVTSTMQYERQMHFQEQNGWARARGYAFPNREFKRELRHFVDHFTRDSAGIDSYYAMLRTTDDAQHMSADIIDILHTIDQELNRLQLEYRAQTGRNLEILILSDHGNNHAGPGKRLTIARFLKNTGYRISSSIRDSRDVILPTAGIQSWAEIHNTPAATAGLVSNLVHLEGVDLVLSQDPENKNEFLVCNRDNARAIVTQDSARKRYRYTPVSGDPLEYQPVLDALRENHALDSDGFASADAWTSATLNCRYPVALQRIARAFTAVTLNPATILLSLDNRFVHASFWVYHASRLVTCAGTHGGLDDLNSTGIVLSNFAATHDTTTMQLARQFAFFAGRNEISGRPVLSEKSSLPRSAFHAGVEGR